MSDLAEEATLASTVTTPLLVFNKLIIRLTAIEDLVLHHEGKLEEIAKDSFAPGAVTLLRDGLAVEFLRELNYLLYPLRDS